MMVAINEMLSGAESMILDNVLYFSIAFAAVVGKLKESAKRNIYAAWAVYLVGTFFHEVSHFLVSLITYGKPSWISLVPTKKVDQKSGAVSYTLGYVKSSNMRWWNAFFISMAPLLLIPLSFWVYKHFFDYFALGLWSLVGYIFVIVSLLFSSIPSGADFKNVFNRDFVANLLIPIFISAAAYAVLEYGAVDLKARLF